jgi:replicative DNA helicase
MSIEIPVPFSESTENSIIAALLTDNGLYKQALDAQLDRLLYTDNNRRVYRAIGRLIGRGVDANALTLEAELKASGEFSTIGGNTFISRLDLNLPRRLNSLSFAGWVDIVRRDARRRELMTLGDAISREASDPTRDVVELWSEAQDRLRDAAMETQVSVPPFSVDAMLEAIRNTPKGLMTGWSSLDHAGIRLRPKELTIIAGRTGHCKSTALLNVVIHQLCRSKDFTGKLVFFSHEEPVELVTCRLIALATRINDGQESDWWSFENVRRHFSGDPVSGLSVRALDEAVAWLRGLEDRLEIIWKPGWNSQSICQYVRAMGSAAAVFMDYLQRVPPPDSSRKADRRDMDISATARDFKTLAIEQSIPVIVAAQIGRQAVDSAILRNIKGLDEEEAIEALRGMRPELNHLREGGSEQEADMILGLMNYAADMSTEAGSKRPPIARRLDIGVLKQRYGPPGTWFTLMHEGLFGRIREVHE